MATYAPIKLPPEDFLKLDELVTEGRYPNRTAAVRSALRTLFKQEFDRRLTEAVRAAYEQQPRTDEERALTSAGARLLASQLDDHDRRS